MVNFHDLIDNLVLKLVFYNFLTFFSAWWRSNMPSDGIGLWDIYMPHGCLKEQIVCSWCLGTILVWYSAFSHVFSFSYFLQTTYFLNNFLPSSLLICFILSYFSIFCWSLWLILHIMLPNPAMVPEFWLTEGGQSATGALLDYITENHVAAPLLSNRASSQSMFHVFWGPVSY